MKKKLNCCGFERSCGNWQKLLLTMKITVFLFFCGLVNLIASPGYSQNTKISLSMEDASIESVLNKIEESSEFYFLFNHKLVDVNRKVDIMAEDRPIRDILDEIFEDDVRFIVSDRQIVLTPNQQTSSDLEKSLQQLTLTGTVTDASTGDPMPGVNIVVKGTTIGTITDIEGKFAFDLNDPNSVIVVTFIGYTPQEIAVAGRRNVDIQMASSIESLDEVVVTALGISREKKSLSYAVTEVSGDNIAIAKEINLGNALTGRIAGVNASGSATGPAGSTRVIIRGNGSLVGDNQPLYVVNGVPIIVENQGFASTYGGRDQGDGLSSINPDDIESISVLKGGTAAALYGSRAANGVILITTKSGRARTGIGVEFNSAFTFENPLTIPKWQYEYGSGSGGLAPSSQLEAIANGRISWGAKLDGSMVVNPDGVARPYVAQKNNIKNFYDTGTTFTNTLAINGGNEIANFRFSVSNTDVKGIVPNSTVNRKTFNLSTNANLSKKLIFEGKAQYNLELNKNRTAIADFTGNPNAAVGLIATNIDVRTLAPGYDENGYETAWSDYVFVSNPYFAASKRKNEDEWKRFIGSFNLRYNIASFLYARARVGIDYANIEGFDITPTGTLHSALGSMSENSKEFSETNAELLFGFEKQFGDVTVNAIAGANNMYTKTLGSNFSSGDLNVPFIYFITNGKTPTFSRSFQEAAINSLFTSADISYKNYLYFTLTGRQDWFSTLAKESNSLFYPSVGLSLILSEVWKSIPDWMSFAKIRTSWAQVGGGAPDPYGLSLTYTAPTSAHLGQPLMYITSSTIPSSLKPYTSTTLEAGLDLRLFNNLLGVDFTVYDRTTTNDIVNASVPPSTGYNSVALNVGEVRNRGVELMLSGSPLRSSSGLNWDMVLNMAYNKNTVVRISEGLKSLALATARTNNGYVYHFEGEPFGMVAGYEMKKDDNGNIVYNNANGIPLMSEFKPLGRGVPPLNISLTNDLSYKNFTFNFMLDSKFGGVLYSAANAYGTYYGLHKSTVANNVRETGVKIEGVDQNGEPYNATIDAQTYFRGLAFAITDEYVYDAGFVKLRQFSLGYSLPQGFLTKTPFQSANISFTARNLFLIYSQIENVDPESNYNTTNGQGLENWGVPPSRSYGFNLLVRF